MATNLYYSPIAFTAAGGGTSPTGYEVANIESPRIAKYWLGETDALRNVTCDMGSSMSIKAILVQDCNIAAADIHTAGADQIYSNQGAMTFATDPTGRRRGLFSIPMAWQYVRISIPVGTPTDGASQWRIGAVWLFGEKIEPMARAPTFGVRQEWVRPSNQQRLPNGQLAVASLGSEYTEVDLSWKDVIGSGDDLQVIYRATLQGAICLQVGYQGWDFWPLELAEQGADMRWSDYQVNDFSLRLKEVV